MLVKFDDYIFLKQPNYHEPTVRQEFAKAVPTLRTIVVYCYDSRVIKIPIAVAEEFNEVRIWLDQRHYR